MRERLEVLNANREAAEDKIEWFQKGKVNEVLFLKDFLQSHPMKFFEGNFYGPDGIISQSAVKRHIYMLLSSNVQTSLAQRTDQLYKALALETAVEEFPADSFVVRVKNGSVRLDGSFEEEQDITRYRLAASYDPDAPEPSRWMSFLDGLLDKEDIPTLQEYLGYCLIPCTKGQVMLFLIGDGGEGKSRITQVARILFGNIMNVSSLHKLESNRFARADLVGKLLMIDDDLRMSALPSTNYIKSIVTQEGKIDTERKREQSEQREMTCRLLCLGNGSPNSLYDHSNGFYRRQIILTTKPKPEGRVDDPYLAEKLTEELDGIFNWCFEGLKRLVANDFRFTVSERARQNLEDLKAAGNSVVSFLASEGYFTLGEGYSATTADLFRSYCLWCRENAEKAVAMRSFSSHLKHQAEGRGLTPSNNIPNADGRKVRGFHGIRVEVKTDFVPYEGVSPFEDP